MSRRVVCAGSVILVIVVCTLLLRDTATSATIRFTSISNASARDATPMLTAISQKGPPSLSLGPAWVASRKRANDLQLVARVYRKSEQMLRGVLLQGLRVFWPPERFGTITLVFDEDAEDRVLARTLLNQYPSLIGNAVFVNRTDVDQGGGPDTQAPGHGYHAQQYDSMWMDRYSSAAFIGIVDSDALLISPVHEENFFDNSGRPRVIPRVETPWGDLWKGAAHAANHFIGKPQPFRCMSYFPVIIKRDHLTQLRAHVEELHNATFGQVYHKYVYRKIPSAKGKLIANPMYSQFKCVLVLGGRCRLPW